MRLVRLLTVHVLVIALPSTAADPASKPDASPAPQKVFLANMEDRPADIRLGSKKAVIAPKKVKQLSATKFPIVIEYWSGDDDVQWKSASVRKPGTYALSLVDGQWQLKARTDNPPAASNNPPSQTPPPSPAHQIVAYGLRLNRYANTDDDRHTVCQFLSNLRAIRPSSIDRWLAGKGVSAKRRASFGSSLGRLKSFQSSEWERFESMTVEEWRVLREEFGDKVKQEDFDAVAGGLREEDEEEEEKEDEGNDPSSQDEDEEDDEDEDEAEFAESDDVDLSEHPEDEEDEDQDDEDDDEDDEDDEDDDEEEDDDDDN